MWLKRFSYSVQRRLNATEFIVQAIIPFRQLIGSVAETLED